MSVNNHDNFDRLKEEFSYRFKMKWDENPDLYIKYYQAKVLDSFLQIYAVKNKELIQKVDDLEGIIKELAGQLKEAKR